LEIQNDFCISLRSSGRQLIINSWQPYSVARCAGWRDLFVVATQRSRPGLYVDTRFAGWKREFPNVLLRTLKKIAST